MDRPSLRTRLLKLRDHLQTGLIERDIPIRLALLALLMGEHLLLVGEPGTAKSLLARRLHRVLREGGYFERLLTRFSVPEELFGPLSIKALEEDRYERQIDGYLPTASIAFLDEIFKANSAILNALLTLLNEREFDNGRKRTPVPLLTVIGASNELAEGEELNALSDRFLLRYLVPPVSDEGFVKLLDLRGEAMPGIPDELRLSREEIEEIRRASASVSLSADLRALLAELRKWSREQQIAISDRRWRKIVRMLQLAAWTDGRDEAGVWEGWLLSHCAWQTPEQQPEIHAWYTEKVGATASANPERLVKIMTYWEIRFKHHQESRTQATDSHGNLVYIDESSNKTLDKYRESHKKRNGDVLYYIDKSLNINENTRTNNGLGYTMNEIINWWYHNRSGRIDGSNVMFSLKENMFFEKIENFPLMETTRHSEIYIHDCIDQLTGIINQINDYLSSINNQIKSLETLIQNHLWIDPEFSGPALSVMKETCSRVSKLCLRALECREKFKELPKILPLEV